MNVLRYNLMLEYAIIHRQIVVIRLHLGDITPPGETKLQNIVPYGDTCTFRDNIVNFPCEGYQDIQLPREL